MRSTLDRLKAFLVRALRSIMRGNVKFAHLAVFHVIPVHMHAWNVSVMSISIKPFMCPAVPMQANFR